MHQIIERFVGRYEVWRRSVPLRNPLNFPAVVLAIGIVQPLYRLCTSHHVAWTGAVLLAVDIAFVVLYFSHSPWAWVVWPVWGVMTLMQLPAFLSFYQRYPSRVGLFTTVFVLLIGVGFIAWGFVIRGRYYAYIRYAPKYSDQHLTKR